MTFVGLACMDMHLYCWNQMTMTQTSHNLNIRNEKICILDTKFCNLLTKPHVVCSQNAQQLIAKHVSTLYYCYAKCGVHKLEDNNVKSIYYVCRLKFIQNSMPYLPKLLGNDHRNIITILIAINSDSSTVLLCLGNFLVL